MIPCNDATAQPTSKSAPRDAASRGWRRLLLAAALAAQALGLTACGGDDGTLPTVRVAAQSAGAPAPAGQGMTMPSIVAQPTDVSTVEGESASFSVMATADSSLGYTWQSSADGVAWSGISVVGADVSINGGVVTLTLLRATLADHGRKFRVVVSSAAGSAISDIATLTVTARPPVLTIAQQPANLTVAAGAPASFTVGATCSGGTLQIQWQRNGVDIAGATAATYSFTTVAGDNAAQFRARLDCSGQAAATSDTATLTVTAPSPTLTFTQQPAAVGVLAGSSAQFTVAATCNGAPVGVFQWQRSNDGGASFFDIGGATDASYTLTAALADDGARFRATGQCNGRSATSDAATLTVTAPPAVAEPSVCSGANGRGWCWVHPVPQGNLLYSLVVDSESQGLAAGWGGALIRTDDAGLTWSGSSLLAPPNSDDVRKINGIARVDATRLIAVGDGRVLTSSDNGATWAGSLLVDPNLHFFGVAARGNRAFAVASSRSGGVLASSADGGRTWTTAANVDRPLYGVAFVSDTLAVAVGARMTVLRSDSLSPSRITTRSNDNLRRVVAIDATTLLAVADGPGDTGPIFRSTDGGESWTPVATEVIFGLRGLDARPSTGIALAAGAGGVMYRSADRGATWTRVLDPQTSFGFQLLDVRFFSDTVAVAVASEGQMLRSTDAGLTWRPVGFSARFTTAINAGALDLHFGGPNVGLMVGQSGMLRTTDGGRSWSNVRDFDGTFVQSVAFADSSIAVALQRVASATSNNFTLRRTTDGGATFTTVGALPAQSLRFNGAGVGIAAGAGGGIWRSVDRGQTWTVVRPGTPIAAAARTQVRWAGNDTVFAIIDNQFLRSGDGGLNWSPVALPADVGVGTVAFRSATEGLALGGSASTGSLLLLSTSDGGLTWTSRRWSDLVGPNPSVAPTELAFADAQTVVAIGNRMIASGASELGVATFLRSTDGGATWRREPIGSEDDLTAIHFTSATDGVVAGQKFHILRTTTAGAR